MYIWNITLSSIYGTQSEIQQLSQKYYKWKGIHQDISRNLWRLEELWQSSNTNNHDTNSPVLPWPQLLLLAIEPGVQFNCNFCKLIGELGGN